MANMNVIDLVNPIAMERGGALCDISIFGALLGCDQTTQDGGIINCNQLTLLLIN